MTDKIKTCGPAFPGGSLTFDDGTVTEPNFPGMTLQDANPRAALRKAEGGE